MASSLMSVIVISAIVAGVVAQQPTMKEYEAKKAGAKQDEADAAANQSKMAAVDKVVSML
jgi:hypothetical protein